MSEYSVEEVRAVVEAIAARGGLFNPIAAKMLTAFAERIKADERAVPVPVAKVAKATHEDARAYPNRYWREVINSTYGGKTGEALQSRVETLIYQRHGMSGALMSSAELITVRDTDDPMPLEEALSIIDRSVRGLREVSYGCHADDLAKARDVLSARLTHPPAQAAKVARPCRIAAERSVTDFLKENLGEVPAFQMAEDGDENWSFWVTEDGCSDDTTSYVHADLSIEWYGTAWEAPTAEPVAPEAKP